MSDIVVRLRHLGKLLGVGSFDIPSHLFEAADRIEELEEALERIVGHDPKIPGLTIGEGGYPGLIDSAVTVARLALAPTEAKTVPDDRSSADATTEVR